MSDLCPRRVSRKHVMSERPTNVCHVRVSRNSVK